jgi:hypothetical protein
MDDLDIVYVCIIVLIIIIIYMNVTSNSYYINVVIKNAFDDLNKNPKIKNLNPKINWKIVNMEIDGYINDKKIVMNQPDPTELNEFQHKNAVAAFLNNVIVFDIDSNNPVILNGSLNGMDNLPITNFLPKNTVIAKSPHGYHYYFYNDIETKLPCYVGLKINDVKYPIDLLTGYKQLIFMPPTKIENSKYYWINSPTTHSIAPISQYMNIIDLFSYTKEFNIESEKINLCVSNSIQKILCIVWDFDIIYQLKYKCKCSYFQKIHANNDEIFYVTGNTYYLFLKYPPITFKKQKQFMKNAKKIIREYNITGGIIHLCSGIKTRVKHKIIQLDHCMVYDNKFKKKLVETNTTLIQTSALNREMTTIVSKESYDDIYNETADDTIIGNDNAFIIFELSNELQIPCVCLMEVILKDESSKYNSLINFYINNILRTGSFESYYKYDTVLSV